MKEEQLSPGVTFVTFDADDDMDAYFANQREKRDIYAINAMKNLTDTQQVIRAGLTTTGINAYGEPIAFYLFTLEEYIENNDEDGNLDTEEFRKHWAEEEAKGWYSVLEICAGNMGIVEFSTQHVSTFINISAPQELWLRAADLDMVEQLQRGLGAAMKRFERYQVHKLVEEYREHLRGKNA